MKRKNGILYNSVRECAYLVNVSTQTFYKWMQIDKEMKAEGQEGFLPNPTMIGKKRFYKDSEVKQIKQSVSKLKKGDLLPYYKKETTYQKLKQENEALKKKLEKIEGGD